MRRARALAAAMASLGVVAPLLAPGCSLGLDASLIDAGARDTSTPASDDAQAPPVSDSSADVASDAADAAQAAACTKNTDCASLTTGCRVGTCVSGHCAAEVCPTAAACQGSSCESHTTCSVPVTYGFHAGTVTVSAGPVGCGGDPTRCLAAAYPFVFVGTANGVVAYGMNDPSSASPPVVPVNGIPFLPNAIIAVGRTVYFLGSVLGVGPTTFKLAIASLVVPTDPLTPSLTATSVFDSYPEPALTSALGSPPGSLFLLDDDSTRFFPIAALTAPLTDGISLPFSPSPGVSPGGTPVVASGSRVVVARWSNDSNVSETWFSLETGAGTGNAQNSGESTIVSSFGQSSPLSTFAQGDDGSVLWNTGAATTDDAGDGVIAAARLAWILSSATATTFSGSSAINVETYNPPLFAGTVVAGPIAWVDAKTVLVLAAAQNELTQTSVQVAINSPSPGVVQSRRYVVPVALGSVGAVSSGGFGYVLANDSATTCTLHAFAPTCAQ